MDEGSAEIAAADQAFKFRVAEAVAQQIAAEQTLVAARLNWNLTFQGFMIASYALVAAAPTTSPTREVIQITIIFAGVIVALATLAGLRAASEQSNYLRQHWARFVGADSHYPRPFAEGRGKLSGRLPSRVICGALILMWVVLLFAGTLLRLGA